MKLLATADLHIGVENSIILKLFKDIIDQEKPDVVVIAGDVYDYRNVNPNYELYKLNKDIQFVYCLGNHEFAYRDIDMVHDLYRFYNKFSNVHCLDIEDYCDIDNIRFTGNVLWYDGSLSERTDVNKHLTHIDKTWLDCTICDFNPVIENRKCIDKIIKSLENWQGKSVLITHTVPYWKLNLFNYDFPNGIYNIYSGVKDLFHDDNINVDVAICGHTHRSVKLSYEKDNKYIRCYNIGNEYYEKSGNIKYEIIEL